MNPEIKITAVNEKRVEDKNSQPKNKKGNTQHNNHKNKPQDTIDDLVEIIEQTDVSVEEKVVSEKINNTLKEVSGKESSTLIVEALGGKEVPKKEATNKKSDEMKKQIQEEFNNACDETGKIDVKQFIENIDKKHEEKVVVEEVIEVVTEEVEKEAPVQEEETKETIDMDFTEEESTTEEQISLLSRFKDYLSSKAFDERCRRASARSLIPKDTIKNATLKKILTTVGDALGIVITMAGDLLNKIIAVINFVLVNAINLVQMLLRAISGVLSLGC